MTQSFKTSIREIVQVGDGKVVETMWAIIVIVHDNLACRHCIYHFFRLRLSSGCDTQSGHRSRHVVKDLHGFVSRPRTRLSRDACMRQAWRSPWTIGGDLLSQYVSTIAEIKNLICELSRHGSRHAFPSTNNAAIANSIS